MGAGELNAEVNPAMDLHPIRDGVEKFLVAICYRNQDKLWLDGLPCSDADVTLFYLTLFLPIPLYFHPENHVTRQILQYAHGYEILIMSKLSTSRHGRWFLM